MEGDVGTVPGPTPATTAIALFADIFYMIV